MKSAMSEELSLCGGGYAEIPEISGINAANCLGCVALNKLQVI